MRSHHTMHPYLAAIGPQSAAHRAPSALPSRMYQAHMRRAPSPRRCLAPNHQIIAMSAVRTTSGSALVPSPATAPPQHAPRPRPTRITPAGTTWSPATCRLAAAPHRPPPRPGACQRVLGCHAIVTTSPVASTIRSTCPNPSDAKLSISARGCASCPGVARGERDRPQRHDAPPPH